MGLRLTSGENKVALFDSVSGFAFGPTFNDHDEAEAFVKWASGEYGDDLRSASDTELRSLYATWIRGSVYA